MNNISILGGVQSKSVDQYDLEKDEWKEKYNIFFILFKSAFLLHDDHYLTMNFLIIKTHRNYI